MYIPSVCSLTFWGTYGHYGQKESWKNGLLMRRTTYRFRICRAHLVELVIHEIENLPRKSALRRLQVERLMKEQIAMGETMYRPMMSRLKQTRNAFSDDELDEEMD